MNNTEFIDNTLTTLYWRARVQKTLLDMFTMLHRQGYARFDSLKAYLSWIGDFKASQTVKSLLHTFEGLAKETHRNGRQHCWDYYSTDEFMNWLATMIVREMWGNAKCI